MPLQPSYNRINVMESKSEKHPFQISGHTSPDKGESTADEPHVKIHKLTYIELDINPKNTSFQLIEVNDQVKLKCSLLLKMQWNSLKVILDNEVQKDPENNDIEKFAETHYPGVPQIAGVNGSSDDGVEFNKELDIKLKKVKLTNRLIGKDADPEVLYEELRNVLNDLTRAYGGIFNVERKYDKTTGTIKSTKVKGSIIHKRKKNCDGTHDERAFVDVGRYQMTQLIKFQVPLASMTSSNSADFPYDAYDIKLAFNMKPIQMLQFSKIEVDCAYSRLNILVGDKYRTSLVSQALNSKISPHFLSEIPVGESYSQGNETDERSSISTVYRKIRDAMDEAALNRDDSVRKAKRDLFQRVFEHIDERKIPYRRNDHRHSGHGLIVSGDSRSVIEVPDKFLTKEDQPVDMRGDTMPADRHTSDHYTYQLLFDFLKNSQKYKALNKPSLPHMTYKKENFYLLVTVKEWPKIASGICKQEFLNFRIKPFSLTIESPYYIKAFRHIRSEKYYETAFSIRFNMVRSITESVVAVVVPLWVQMILQLLTYLFSVPDFAFIYMIALLVSLFVYRGVLQFSGKHTSGITWADTEFLFVLIVTVTQFLLFMGWHSPDCLHRSDSHLLDWDTCHRIRWGVFMTHAICICFFIAYDIRKICMHYSLLSYKRHPRKNSGKAITNSDGASTFNLAGHLHQHEHEKNQAKIITFKEYSKLVRLHDALQANLYEMMDEQCRDHFSFDRKTYLSLNLKILSRKDIPYDLFRWRGSADRFFSSQYSDMKPLYVKANQRGFKKEVYKITILNTDHLFEVQFSPPNFNYNDPAYAVMHDDHKRESLWSLNPRKEPEGGEMQKGKQHEQVRDSSPSSSRGDCSQNPGLFRDTVPQVSPAFVPNLDVNKTNGEFRMDDVGANGYSTLPRANANTDVSPLDRVTAFRQSLACVLLRIHRLISNGIRNYRNQIIFVTENVPREQRLSSTESASERNSRPLNQQKSDETAAALLTPWQLRMMFLESLCFEAYFLEWMHMLNDYSLYCIAMSIIKTKGGVAKPVKDGYFYNS